MTFGRFVERLATGRRLVITSDHGTAATGYSRTRTAGSQFLKKDVSSGRSKAEPETPALRATCGIAKQQHERAFCWPLAAGSGATRAATGRLTMADSPCSRCCRPFVELTKSLRIQGLMAAKKLL